MSEAVTKVLAIILAAYVMFLFPTYQIAKKQEDLTYLNVEKNITNFVDNVRMKGYITPQMYNDFEQSLHTGSEVLFQVEAEHQQKKYVPVYKDPSDATSFENKYEVHYESFGTKQIMDVLYDESKPEEERIYKLQNGDFFNLVITNKTKFKSSMLLSFMTGGLADNDEVIYYPYGGMVLNEDWADF